MALSHAERIALGLDDPPPQPPTHGASLNGEQEFMPAGVTVLRPTQPNPRLQLSPGDRATAPKIRGMVNELLALNLDAANTALQQLLAANPKVGLETYAELMKFAMPQLKAIAVQVDDRSDNPRTLTFQQLQSALAADD